METRLQLNVEGQTVSAALTASGSPRAVYVMAHGAGAGMDHVFMRDMAERLAAREVAVLRYNFVYMEGRKGRVDSPALAHAAVRAAVAEARVQLPGVPIVAGGKSFGGRMTSQAQAASPLPEVVGLAFLGFPLHPPGKPGVERAAHLADVQIPMLFMQGARDEFAQPALLQATVDSLSDRATLLVIPDGDHSFAVRKASGLTPQMVKEQLCDALVAWLPNL